MNDYASFLKTKEVLSTPCGITPVSLSPMLFDFQRDIVRWALKRGRAAIFADCGMGKTPMQLEWARHIPGKVLILAPLAVSEQTVREGQKFGIDVAYQRFGSADEKITITNYEMMGNFDPYAYKGIILDESSILKSQDGKTRKAIIDAFAKTDYRLACTATPAPNDYMELGNHAEFLGIMSMTEMLSMFFVHDGAETQKWRLKGHAQDIFWKWMASWSVMIKRPSDLGYSDDAFVLPPLTFHEHVVESKDVGEFLFPMQAATLPERIRARRNSTDDRVAGLVRVIKQSPDQWLIWCNLNKESNAITKSIPNAVEIQGSDKPEFKASTMLAFSEGKIRVLVTKPSIAGFGMNWQNCHNVAFLGLSDSYEQFYQAMRRCWRFGQKSPVNCHIVIANTEGAVLANIKRKEADAERMAINMVEHMKKLTQSEIKGTSSNVTLYEPSVDMVLPNFILPTYADEEWRNIIDGHYQVSNYGRVKRITPAKGARPGHILAQPKDNNGYVMTSICIDGKRTPIRSHVLVADAFLGARPEGYEINHIDGNTSNPRLTNLEYVTKSENGKHAWRTGLQPKRERSIK